MSSLATAQDSRPTPPVLAKQAVNAKEIAENEKDLATINALLASNKAASPTTTVPPPSQQLENLWWSNTNAMTMSASVLIFGLLALLLASYVIRKGQSWEAVLKIFGTVLIVVMTVFLIVAGYDDKQIAPAIGLLGTIVGYLLGKDVSKPVGKEITGTKTQQ